MHASIPCLLHLPLPLPPPVHPFLSTHSPPSFLLFHLPSPPFPLSSLFLSVTLNQYQKHCPLPPLPCIMSIPISNREFLDCVEIFERPRPLRTAFAMPTIQTKSSKRSSHAKAAPSERTSSLSPTTTLPPWKKTGIASKTPPNLDFGRWFVHSVEIPQRTKAPPKKKTGLRRGPERRHSVPSLKSRVKDIFGSDESFDDEEEVKKVTKTTRVHQAEKDKAEREKRQEALLLNIFGGNDDDLPLKPSARLPTQPNASSTVVFATSIFASKNRDHDKVQEDNLELNLTPTQRSQPPPKKLQPRLQSPLQHQQTSLKRPARPLSKATVMSSSSSGSEDNEGQLGNRNIVSVISSAPQAFKQIEGPKLQKTAMVFDRNRAVPAQISQPADSSRSKKSGPIKMSNTAPPAAKKSRVRSRMYSSEDDLQSEVKSLIKVTRLTKRRAMPQKNKFTRNLEKLKRARLGLSPLPSSSDSSSGESRDSDSDDSDESSGFDITRSQRIPNKQDKAFIVDDLDEAEHSLNDIPDEFRLSSHQDLDTDFKIYIQYLLNLSFDPDFEQKHKDDNYFKHSVIHVVKTLGSYQTSMTVSQKWSRQFRRQLDIRPHYKKEYIPNMGLPCDACQIISRPATQRVVIYGEKYVLPKSLRDASHLEDFEHSDSDSSSDSSSVSDLDNPNDKESIDFTFNVGKTCCQRSYIYHKLRHWTYYCARSIEKDSAKLQMQEATKNEARNQPSRNVDTNVLLEKLEQAGVVKKLLSEFKQALNEARDLERAKD